MEVEKGSSNPLRTTLVHTGRGIVLNSLAVSGGIYILTLSRIRMLRMFGDLVATVLLVTMFYTLMVLPLLLHAVEYGNNKITIKRIKTWKGDEFNEKNTIFDGVGVSDFNWRCPGLGYNSR